VSTDARIADLRAAYAELAEMEFDLVLERNGESPIERLLLAQMLCEGWDGSHPQRSWVDMHDDARAIVGPFASMILASDDCSCMCLPQLDVAMGAKRYRLDFAFIGLAAGGRQVRIAVELDGHDFHERTKEQASKDKKRDRVLAANGWVVLRFTGSDVYRDPAAVLDEIVKLANRASWPDHGADPCSG
jgi:very-short-patch-repair endonuclease